MNESGEAVSGVVTVTPTIMDGTVVRWFLSLADAENREPIISVSRNRVIVEDDQALTTEIEAAAYAAHNELRRNPDADMHHLATHRREGVWGPLMERHGFGDC